MARRATLGPEDRLLGAGRAGRTCHRNCAAALLVGRPSIREAQRSRGIESVVFVGCTNPASRSQQVENLERRKKPPGNAPRRKHGVTIRGYWRNGKGGQVDLLVSIDTVYLLT